MDFMKFLEGVDFSTKKSVGYWGVILTNPELRIF